MIPSLDVYDGSSGDDVYAGRAHFMLRRGAVSTTFSYAESYMARNDAYAIDPAFPISGATHHCAGLPGSFRDSSPDRWGRHLILREHHASSIAQNESPCQLDEVDFLVGVFDKTREGALRFRLPEGGFLAQSRAVPPIVELPALLEASRRVAKDDAGMAQIKELLDAGSGSLGGARPKASVRDGDRLLLAKFSHPEDEWDVMGWEKTMLDMAHDVGIRVPDSRLVALGGERVLLLDRFDREGSDVEGRRIPYMSAMTALRAADGDRRDYAELAEELPMLVDDVRAQLAEMFRRVVFSVAVHNTDDHLRNWGFIRRKGTWEHAPLFDVNPCPYANASRATSIMGEAEREEAEALRSLAAYAQLDDEAASDEVRRVLSVVSGWEAYAVANGCAKRELDLFRPVFDDREKALRRAFGI